MDLVEVTWYDVSWGRMANMWHLKEFNERRNILINQKQRIRWFNHRKAAAARKQRECAITAPLTIASAAPSTWEAPDPSEVPLPRFDTMLPDILSMMERGECSATSLHAAGFGRPVRSEVLILLQEMD